MHLLCMCANLLTNCFIFVLYSTGREVEINSKDAYTKLPLQHHPEGLFRADCSRNLIDKLHRGACDTGVPYDIFPDISLS